MTILLSVHNILRWVVLIFGVLAVFGALKDKPKFLKGYAISITLQFLLGLILWINILFSYGFNSKEFLIRFFVLEHPILMTLSLISSHIALAKSRKGGNAWKVLITLSFVLLLIGIPWWRPLIRL